MNRNLLFLVLAGALIAAVLLVVSYYARRLRVATQKGWETLLGDLLYLDRDNLDAVALDAIHPPGHRRTDEDARALGPEEIWTRLGGLDGVGRLAANSRVLVEMADFLQRSYPDATDVAAELRRGARELELYVTRLQLANEQGSLEFHIPTYAQNAAIAYYLMEQRLQALCQRVRVRSFRPLPQSH